MATEGSTLDDAAEIRRRLAVQIARIRAARGLTQQEVSDRTGLIRTAISEIEGGHRGVSVIEWIRISAALGVNPTSMLGAALPTTAAPGAEVAVGLQLAALSDWIDGSNLHRDPEAITWGRLAKLQEEAGEAADELLLLAVRKLGLDSAAGRVVSAFIGATGQNPRKGVTHTTDDVVKELLDVAVTALGAVEHLVGNDGSSMDRLAEFVGRLVVRAGLASRAAVSA